LLAWNAKVELAGCAPWILGYVKLQDLQELSSGEKIQFLRMWTVYGSRTGQSQSTVRRASNIPYKRNFIDLGQIYQGRSLLHG
jgi:hypothetical protein